MVYADSDRLSQVVSNLVSNALRYTPTGGAVTVEVKPEVSHRPNPSRQELPEVLVSVTDTGTGIPEADLPHVFDRFYRADKSRTRASGGSGLGLAIVKHLVEAHGGRVWIESPVLHTAEDRGYGTRVSFTIPASQIMISG